MHVLKDFTLAPDKVVGGMEQVKWGQRRVCKEKTFAALIVTGGSPESQCLRDAAWLLVSRGRLELTYGADIQSGTWQPSQLTLGCEQADRSVSVRSPARGSSLQNLSEPFSRHSCLRIPAASAWPVQGEPHEVWVECSVVGRTERLTTPPTHTHPASGPGDVSVALSGVCGVRLCVRSQVLPACLCIWGTERHPQSLASPRDSGQANVAPVPWPDSADRWEPVLSSRHADPKGEGPFPASSVALGYSRQT